MITCPKCDFEFEPNDLTPRELEALEFLCEGLSNKEIGIKMNIEPRTVKSHLNKACLKYGVRGRVRLAAKYLNNKYNKEKCIPIPIARTI